jgi:hypothetical protein
LDKIKKRTDQISVYLSEDKILSSEVKGDVQSYGFTGYSSMGDFPIKGKAKKEKTDKVLQLTPNIVSSSDILASQALQ